MSHFPEDKIGAERGEVTSHEVTSDGEGTHTRVWLSSELLPKVGSTGHCSACGSHPLLAHSPSVAWSHPEPRFPCPAS